MGGPLWTDSEEEYFWGYIIAHSDKKLGYDKDKDKAKTWSLLAEEMQVAMDEKFREMGKDGAPRRYTSLTLMEHWDKNIMQNRPGEAAKKYAKDYVERMETADPDRWERRKARQDRTDSGDGSKAKKKRKRASEGDKPARTPSTGPTSKRRPVGNGNHDDDYDDEDGIDEHGSGPSFDLSSDLPSLRHLIGSGQPSATATPRRQLFPSGRTIAGNDPRTLPGPGFADLSNNGYTRYLPYRPAPPPPTQPDIWATVWEAIDQRMADINDLVRDDIHRVVRAEVANNIGSVARDEVERGLGAVIRAEVARQLPALVRDEVARQLSSSIRRAPAMGPPAEIERLAEAMFMYPGATIPLSARPMQHQHQQPQQQQSQQRFDPFGHGGPHTFGQPPVRPFSPAPRPEAGPGGTTARSTTRTPLPTGRVGQFPTSDVRSRVLGRSRGNPADEEKHDVEMGEGTTEPDGR